MPETPSTPDVPALRKLLANLLSHAGKSRLPDGACFLPLPNGDGLTIGRLRELTAALDGLTAERDALKEEVADVRRSVRDDEKTAAADARLRKETLKLIQESHALRVAELEAERAAALGGRETTEAPR